jgi:hypothetical protein
VLPVSRIFYRLPLNIPKLAFNLIEAASTNEMVCRREARIKWRQPWKKVATKSVYGRKRRRVDVKQCILFIAKFKSCQLAIFQPMLHGMIFNDNSQCKWSCARFDWLGRLLRCELSLKIIPCNIGLMAYNICYIYFVIYIIYHVIHIMYIYLERHSLVTYLGIFCLRFIFCRTK